MRINRRVDSTGATRWVKRAETLARSIRQKYQAKHEIQDGYLLEGKRAGNIRTARVMDLPGRFVPFGHIGIATTMGGSTESWWPKPVGAPVRRVMLEAGVPEDDDSEPIDISIDHDVTEGRPLVGWSIGEPPAGGLRSLGISEPYSSHKWIVQVRTVYPNTDPLPVVLPPGGTDLLYRYPTIDYSSVSSLWVMVDVWGVGATRSFTLLINESVIEVHLGYPIIRREPSDWSSQGSDTRAWATMVSLTKFVVAVWLSDGEPAGKAGSLGLMAFEWVEEEDEDTGEGYWDVVSARRLSNDDMPHPLFQTHYRSNQDGEQVMPPERSFMVPQSVTMNNDGRQAVFLATLYHEMDGLIDDDPVQYAPFVVSGVLRVSIDLESYEIATEISHVNTDSELQYGSILISTNGVSVAGNIDYPWNSGEWAVYCYSHYDGETLHEIVGLSRGIRTDTEEDTAPGILRITRHRYDSPTTHLKITTTTYDEEGDSVVGTVDINTSDAALNSGVAPGATLMSIYEGFYALIRFGITFGGYPGLPATYCGMGVYEMSMYVGGSSTGASVLFRFDTANGTVDRVPAPPVSLSLSTCYAVAREVEDEEGNKHTIPARTVVTYLSGGIHTLEIRSGDDVIATTKETTLDYRLGAYYLGNPFVVTQYGKMEALV